MWSTQQELALVAWAQASLRGLGYTCLEAEPAFVKRTPWSCVYCFQTSQGNFYLKATPAALALEPQLLAWLARYGQAPVPQLIAVNSSLHAFLMRDAGQPLRHILKQHFDPALLAAAVVMFVKLQQVSSQHLAHLTEMGVPDWRFAQWSSLFSAVLADHAMLAAEGISSAEAEQLSALVPVMAARCRLIAKTPIPNSLVQPDFHDNNVLIEPASSQLTLIDVGELVISHPFLSLTNALQQFKHHHAITEQDPIYVRLLNTMLEPFLQYATADELHQVMAQVASLHRIYSVLSEYRLIQCCGYQTISSYQPNKFGHALRALLRDGL